MPAGADQLVQFVVDVDDYNSLATSATAIDNHVSVAAADGNGAETIMTDNEDDASVPIEVADIGVTKEDDVDPVLHIHDDFNYTITVTNHSETTTATNVHLHDELPEGVGFVGFTSTGSAICSETDGVIDCTVSTLASGESVVVIINVTGDVPGRVVNEVTVRADQQDMNRENNRDEEETLIDPADLEVVKQADRSAVGLGETITYTLDVTNHGPDVATDTVVVDTLPGGLRIISVEPEQGVCTTSGQEVNCNLGTLDDQAETSVTVTARASRLGSLTNRVIVSSNEYDPNPLNNESEAVVSVFPLAPNTGLGRTTYTALPIVAAGILAFVGVRHYRRRYS